MGWLVKGDVVVTPFPFSDTTGAKRRPALVAAVLTGDDVLLCQITSQSRSDGYSVALGKSDFASGGLHHDSYIRPNRLFTGDSRVVHYKTGSLTPTKLQEVITKIVHIVTT